MASRLFVVFSFSLAHILFRCVEWIPHFACLQKVKGLATQPARFSRSGFVIEEKCSLGRLLGLSTLRRYQYNFAYLLLNIPDFP
jgi:hypothetical protein